MYLGDITVWRELGVPAIADFMRTLATRFQDQLPDLSSVRNYGLGQPTDQHRLKPGCRSLTL